MSQKSLLRAVPKSSASASTEIIQRAREHIFMASTLLQQLGGSQEKLSWILEDALFYFEDCSKEAAFQIDSIEAAPLSNQLRLRKTVGEK